MDSFLSEEEYLNNDPNDINNNSDEELEEYLMDEYSGAKKEHIA